jgi:predicted ester cyclase
VHGREGLATEVTAHRTAFPDWAEEVEDEIVDRDRIAARFTSRGTNTGDFLGNPPTGARVEISEVAIFRLEDGKIAEQWVYPDILSLQRQLNARSQQ